MAEKNNRVTVSAEELALSNSLTLAALVEIMEENGVLTRDEVLQRVRVIQDEKQSGCCGLRWPVGCLSEQKIGFSGIAMANDAV